MKVQMNNTLHIRVIDQTTALFQERLQACIAEIQNQDGALHQLYEECVDADMRHKIAQLPIEVFNRVGRLGIVLRFRIPARVLTYAKNSQGAVRFGHNDQVQLYVGWVPTDHGIVWPYGATLDWARSMIEVNRALTHEVFAAHAPKTYALVQEHFEHYERIVHEEAELLDSLHEFLNSHVTLNQAMLAWPGLDQYLTAEDRERLNAKPLRAREIKKKALPDAAKQALLAAKMRKLTEAA